VSTSLFASAVVDTCPLGRTSGFAPFSSPAFNRSLNELVPADGLLIKTLFQPRGRDCEFAEIRVEDLFLDELMVLINKGKGEKSRYVSVLAERAKMTDAFGKSADGLSV